MDEAQVAALARLAKLSFSGEELSRMTAEFQSILDFAGTINQAAVSQNTVLLPDMENALRPDEVIPSSPREEILSNVEGENGFFYLPKRSR